MDMEVIHTQLDTQYTMHKLSDTRLTGQEYSHLRMALMDTNSLDHTFTYKYTIHTHTHSYTVGIP